MGVERGPWVAARPTLVPTTGVVVLLAVGTAGCTMCPDPFDYSGPVPNGAVTQNDFGARSNGILPLRAAPSPWPTVVEAEPTPAEPVLAGDAGEAIVPESVLRIAEAPALPDPQAEIIESPAQPEEPVLEEVVLEEVELEASEVR